MPTRSARPGRRRRRRWRRGRSVRRRSPWCGSPISGTARAPTRVTPPPLGSGRMVHVLSSRTLIRPSDPERSRRFYGEQLGLAVYREFGDGPDRGTVYFLGGGFLEVSGRSEVPPSPAVRLWLQVEDAGRAHEELRAKGVEIVR